MDRLSCMAAFVRAVDAGSFVGAAEQANTSPQMIAKQVSYLEARLGLRLLQRTTRRQSLTEAGALFYERCKDVLAAVDDAEALTSRLNAVPRGHLRVTAPSSFGRHSLMPTVAAFLVAHPEVNVSLTLTDRIVDLTDEGFDAAIRIGAIGTQSLVPHPLAPYRLIACASPAYVHRCGKPVIPSDLVGHEMLGYAYWSRPAEKVWTFTRGQEVVSVPCKGRMEVNDSGALAAAALSDFGVVLGPEDALHSAIAAGRLVRLLPDYLAPARPVNLLHAPDRRRPPKLTAFVDWIVARHGPLRTPSPP